MNLHEILDKVPMVERTPDGKLYVGEPGSTFLVVRNGKKDVLFDNPDMLDQTLRALPAKAFEKVTVKLMPESRYGNYRYVLNIDADKTNRLFGAINNHQDSYDTNDGKLNVGTAVLASYNRLRMSLGGEFANTNSPRSKQTLEQRFHADGSQLHQEGKTHRNGETFGAGGAFSYDIAPPAFRHVALQLQQCPHAELREFVCQPAKRQRRLGLHQPKHGPQHGLQSVRLGELPIRLCQT